MLRRENIFRTTKRRTQSAAKAPSTRSATPESNFHHHVYVVLLHQDVARLKKVQKENPHRDPSKPCVYVGMTGLEPFERFENHKHGIKSAFVVQKYGLRLLPELFVHLNPMPFDSAVVMERELAEDLRNLGYTVTGGH